MSICARRRLTCSDVCPALTFHLTCALSCSLYLSPFPYLCDYAWTSDVVVDGDDAFDVDDDGASGGCDVENDDRGVVVRSVY